jgi:glycosyltransferase involved in cell wall biosynthesis
MARKSSAVIAASPDEAHELRQIAGAKKIVVRHNGIDIESLARLPSPNLLRERWKVAAYERIVLFIGRLSPIKNIEQLITAFGRASIPNGRLVLVGPSEHDYEHQLKITVTREGLKHCVTFAGPLYDDEQKAALAAAHLFVLPSLNESFGNAAGEAVAAGVPVLLTENCGIAPIIHGRAGLAVPLGVDSLSEGLRAMMDPEMRHRMTEGREEVKRELSWDEPIRQTEELYRRIIAEGAPVMHE